MASTSTASSTDSSGVSARDRRPVWWRPDRLPWWIGCGFAIGSVLFFVPAVAALSSTATWIGPAFFAGSIFFTTASALQLYASSGIPHRGRSGLQRRLLRPRGWMPRHIDWLSAAIQLPGTVLFNFNTFDAMNFLGSAGQTDATVWTPDMIGSGCFLAASLLAFANADHRWLSWRPDDLDWWITIVNLAGSVAFGISALTSFVSPVSDQELNATITNLATALGAACFFSGALLLFPQVERQRSRLR